MIKTIYFERIYQEEILQYNRSISIRKKLRTKTGHFFRGAEIPAAEQFPERYSQAQ
jgi:hypothetical protein